MPDIIGPVFTDIEDYGVQLRDEEGHIFSLSVSENLYEDARVDKEALGSIWESDVITEIKANDESENEEDYTSIISGDTKEEFRISDDMVEEFDAPTNSITYKWDYWEAYYSYDSGGSRNIYYYPRISYQYAYSTYSTSDTIYFPNPVRASTETAKSYRVLEVVEWSKAVSGDIGKIISKGGMGYCVNSDGQLSEVTSSFNNVNYVNFANYIGSYVSGASTYYFTKYSSLYRAIYKNLSPISPDDFWAKYNNAVNNNVQITKKNSIRGKIYCDTFHRYNLMGGFLAEDVTIENSEGVIYYNQNGEKVDTPDTSGVTIPAGTTVIKSGTAIGRSGAYNLILMAIIAGIERGRVTVNDLSGDNSDGDGIPPIARIELSMTTTSYGATGAYSNIEDSQTGYISAIGGDPFWSRYWGPFRCRGYLKEVHIPEGYHYIGPGAFYHTNIERLYLPKVNKKDVQGNWQTSLRIHERACIDNYCLEDVYINNEHTDFTTSAPLSSFFTPRNGTVHFLDGSITYKDGSSQGFKTTGAYQFVNKT